MIIDEKALAKHFPLFEKLSEEGKKTYIGMVGQILQMEFGTVASEEPFKKPRKKREFGVTARSLVLNFLNENKGEAFMPKNIKKAIMKDLRKLKLTTDPIKTVNDAVYALYRHKAVERNGEGYFIGK